MALMLRRAYNPVSFVKAVNVLITYALKSCISISIELVLFSHSYTLECISYNRTVCELRSVNLFHCLIVHLHVSCCFVSVLTSVSVRPNMKETKQS